MLEVGSKAPGFELPDQNGTMRSLEEFKGKKVILYFYPRTIPRAAPSRHAASESCILSFRRRTRW